MAGLVDRQDPCVAGRSPWVDLVEHQGVLNGRPRAPREAAGTLAVSFDTPVPSSEGTTLRLRGRGDEVSSIKRLTRGERSLLSHAETPFPARYAKLRGRFSHARASEATARAIFMVTVSPVTVIVTAVTRSP